MWVYVCIHSILLSRSFHYGNHFVSCILFIYIYTHTRTIKLDLTVCWQNSKVSTMNVIDSSSGSDLLVSKKRFFFLSRLVVGQFELFICHISPWCTTKNRLFGWQKIAQCVHHRLFLLLLSLLNETHSNLNINFNIDIFLLNLNKRHSNLSFLNLSLSLSLCIDQICSRIKSHSHANHYRSPPSSSSYLGWSRERRRYFGWKSEEINIESRAREPHLLIYE